nr:hypothetical protein Iba_chr14bCG12960 [Ipomoea batatas]
MAVPVNAVMDSALFDLITCTMPKSASLTEPETSTNMFAHLISLWATFRSCKYFNPCKICLV